MSETYTTTYKGSSTTFLSERIGDKAKSWQDVIVIAKERIKSLEAAIEIFESYRDSEEPFTVESGIETKYK